MASPLNLFYWDACIFYEYCRGDQPDRAKSQAIGDMLAENKDHRNRICTSVFTHAEIIPKKLGEAAERSYWNCFGSLYFFDVEADRSVIVLAREIRDYYYKPADESGTYRLVSMGDAIHLSTAIIHQATELHTRDGNRKGGNVPLLGLDGSSPGGKICGKYDLKIVSPTAQEVRLID